MALTDIAIRNARAQSRSYTLTDGQSLYLRVDPNGRKTWIFRFYWDKVQKKRTLGPYPLIGARQARALRDECKKHLLLGIMPTAKHVVPPEQASRKPPCRVSTYAQQWKAAKFNKLGVSALNGRRSTAAQIELYLKKDILPVIGDLPVQQVGREHIIHILRGIERRGASEIRKKVYRWLHELFRYARAEGLIDVNPVDEEINVLFRKPPPARNNPYLTMAQIPEFLVALHQQQAVSIQNRLGVRLLLLTGVRPGELRAATLEQFDLENALWTIPPENVKQLRRHALQATEMKHRKIHEIPPYMVPLSRQALDVVKQLVMLRHPAQHFVLSHRSQPTCPISENTLNHIIQRMGYKDRLTSHGIRATLSTALNELGYNRDWIEAQLSHSDKDPIRRTYNHAAYVPQRRQMMQAWADLLDQWLAQEFKNRDISAPVRQ